MIKGKIPIRFGRNSTIPSEEELLKIGKCIKILVKVGVDINDCSIFDDAILNLLENQNSKDIDTIVKYAKNFEWKNVVRSKYFNRFLSTCFIYVNAELLKQFIFKGLDIKSNSFLYEVIKTDNENLVEFINQEAKNIDWNSTFEKIPLSGHAIILGKRNVVITLIKQGVRLKFSNELVNNKIIKTLEIENITDSYNRILLTSLYPIDFATNKNDLLHYNHKINDDECIILSLINKSYSRITGLKQYRCFLKEFLSKQILRDVLFVNSREHDSTIELVGDMTHYLSKDYSGLYQPNLRVVIGYNRVDKFKKGTFLHELSHSMFCILNNGANNLPYNCPQEKDAYEQGIFRILDNLAIHYLGVSNLASINIYKNSTYEYGKFLSTAHVPIIRTPKSLITKLAGSISIFIQIKIIINLMSMMNLLLDFMKLKFMKIMI